MTRLIFIRHGDTQWTAEKRYQGWSDLPLSEKGRKAIRILSQKIRHCAVDKIYASPLRRARDSAQAIAKILKQKVHLDQRLKEMRFGRWEGKTAAELIARQDPAYLAWLKNRARVSPGGESYQALLRRVRAFLRDCLKKHPEDTVAVVCHGGPIRMLLLECLRLTRAHLFSFRIDPASVTIVNVDSKSGAIRRGVLHVLNQTFAGRGIA